jgi:hypothetical protein
MDLLLPKLGDYGIYNCRNSRTGSTLSLHGEGRAWDCAIPWGETALGDSVAKFYVLSAEMLGIQRVIWGFGAGKAPREWDSRAGERYWEAYSGPAHDDHIHVELCWKAALNLTAATVRTAFRTFWEGEKEEDEVFIQVGNGIWHIVGDRRVKVNAGTDGPSRVAALKKVGVIPVKVAKTDPLVTKFRELKLKVPA